MSGIYIPGMEMPKNCFDCPLFDDVYTDADGDDDYSCGLGVPLDYYQASGKTKKNCPLVPIPPNGRLIDADLIMEKLKESCRTAFGDDGDISECSGLSIVADYIESAPTVIPASEEAE